MNKLARKAKFVQREGKLNGSLFLDLIVFNSENLKSQSLNDLSIGLKDKYGVEITKQSLHDRFSKYALFFLKDVLEKLLNKKLRGKQSFLTDFKGFNRVLIKDSTCFQVDKSLAEYYPGSGGSGSKASIRIQFEYNILSGKINDLSVNAFNAQDAKNSVATIELTESKDLIIRDLAYMSLKVLKLIAKKASFFLCRASTNVTIYEKREEQYVKVDFIKTTYYMKNNNIKCMEKNVYLGNKEKFKVRLILHLLPEKEVAKRLRASKKNNKKKGRGNLSKEYKARANLNLFITNTSQEQIPMNNVWQLYRQRWQIELIFKIWKSICDIAKVKKVKKYRLECYIYSKLILIVLCWQITWKIAKNLFIKEGKALSFLKISKTLFHKKIHELREIFMGSIGSIEMFINNIYDLSKTNHLLEKKQNIPTSLEQLLCCLNI